MGAARAAARGRGRGPRPAAEGAEALSGAELLGLDAWDRVEPLLGGRGGASLAWNDGRPHVVKQYRGDDPARGARERAALHALGGAAGVPVLLGEGDEPPTVVMSWLDGSGSLADALLGDDPRHAAEALGRWAEALAALHRAGTAPVRSAFVAALAERAPGLSPRILSTDFAAAADRYAEALSELGLPTHEAGLAELRGLPDLLGDPDDEVLSPADTCPDNNVVGPDGVHLLDFEYAELRHPAWDLAYLLTPWPTCWCAWALPDDVARAALARYQPDLGDAVELAALGWQAMTPGLFMAGALASDDRDAGPERTTRRAFVLHRLAAVAGSDRFSALAAMAGDLHAALRQRWGDVRLELAPAFR